MHFFRYSVAIYDDPLYSSHRGLGDRSDSDGGESEDSNDENNWRNDYPDEDEDVFGEAASVDEDDIRRAVEEFDLGGIALFIQFNYFNLNLINFQTVIVTCRRTRIITRRKTVGLPTRRMTMGSAIMGRRVLTHV